KYLQLSFITQHHLCGDRPHTAATATRNGSLPDSIRLFISKMLLTVTKGTRKINPLSCLSLLILKEAGTIKHNSEWLRKTGDKQPKSGKLREINWGMFKLKPMLHEMTMRFGTDLAKNMETSLNEMAPNIIRSAKEGSQRKLYANLIGPAEETTEGLVSSAALILLPALFKENASFLYSVNIEPKGPTPTIVFNGSPDTLKAESVSIIMDNVNIIREADIDMTQAVECLFAVYFLFNVQYPVAIKNTMTFIQKYLLKLKSPHDTRTPIPVLKILYNCSIGSEGCVALTSALRSNPSHLTQLDLSCNNPGDSGVKLLSDLLKDPHCQLHKLLLSDCNLTEESCSSLASVLRSNSSSLTELNLSHNKLQDSGVKLLSDGLKNTNCN
ncbi:putative NACHT, partial [Triplophysa rosa]